MERTRTSKKRRKISRKRGQSLCESTCSLRGRAAVAHPRRSCVPTAFNGRGCPCHHNWSESVIIRYFLSCLFLRVGRENRSWPALRRCVGACRLGGPKDRLRPAALSPRSSRTHKKQATSMEENSLHASVFIIYDLRVK